MTRQIAASFLASIREEENRFHFTRRSDGYTEGTLNEVSHVLGSNYQSIELAAGEFRVGSTLSSDRGHSYPYVLTEYLLSRIYAFKAERVKAGKSAFGHSKVLESDIRNLPEVLNSLQGVPSLRDRINQYIREIFPHIDHVSVLPVAESGEIRVLLWPHGVGAREDLAIPLSESGTGTGQVLALLYVVLTEQPQIILIDEPQSFLHPGAARKLIEILKSNEQHQFIVATHSAEIISAAAPNRILVVRKVGSESRIEVIEGNQQRITSLLLHDLGVRLADVFGADRILWVEGKTEELCFPLILKHQSSMPLRGTAILAVSNTGDFDRRRAPLATEVYRRLSNGAGLLPPAIGFVFDPESRSEAVRARFKTESGVAVEFLPRRMFECYLLDPEAIASVLSRSAELPVSSDRVEQWWNTEGVKRKYFPKGSPQGMAHGKDWVVHVDAAALLADMFRELSCNTVEFSKTRHSVELTEYLLEHRPEALNEVRDLIIQLLLREPTKVI